MNSEQIELFNWFFDILPEEVLNVPKLRSEKIVNFISPDELTEKLPLKLTKEGESLDALKQLIINSLNYGVKTYHPHFYNQLYCPPMVTAMLGALYTARLNYPMNTTEEESLHNKMEKSLFTHLLSYVGWENGSAIFTPGGSMGNFYGIFAAREKCFPNVEYTGLPREVQPRIYCSDLSHYSITKGAIFLGLGTNCVVKIATDENGRMKSTALRENIENDILKGYIPLMVVATGGTTVFGAFDPFNEIADICQEFELYMHVDACLGGSCLLISEQRHSLSGLERADSFSWNPHKLMGVCLQTSVFFSREKNSLSINKLRVERELICDDSSLKKGENLPHCIFGDNRTVNVFKLWLNWIWLGSEGYANCMNKKYQLTCYLANEIIKRDKEFHLITWPQSLNVCFYYVPIAMRNQTRNEEWWKKLNLLPAKAKGLMVFDGSLMVAYQEQKQLPVFYRMVCNQYHNNEADMDFVLETIAKFSEIAYEKYFV